MQKIEIVKSDYVQELCTQEGITMYPDIEALDTIAHHYKVDLPEDRRLLVLGNREFVHDVPHTRIVMPGQANLPTPRGPGDILINLPEGDTLDEADLTLRVVRSFASRRAAHLKHNILRRTAGAVLGGAAVSFVGDIIAHNKIAEFVGYGIFVLSAAFAAHISTRQTKLPDNASLFDPPILLRTGQ